MKRKEEDELISEKMKALDALSVGIVFGKEEAWNKLQARLEDRPVKKLIFFKYRMAAAAVFLLMVCGVAGYHYSGKDIVRIDLPFQVKTLVNNQVLDQQITRIVQPEKTVTHRTTPFINSIKNSLALPPAKEETLVRNDTASSMPGDTITGAIAVALVPANPPSNAMKVVHINELENPVTEQGATAMAINTVERINFSSMHVFYINDVEKEEVELKAIIHESHTLLGHNPFKRPAYWNLTPSTQEYSQPHNLLKSLFNTEN
jgi:hypothetical protein